MIISLQVESTELSELAETDTLKSSKQPVLKANHDAIKQEMEHSYEFCMQSPQPNATGYISTDDDQDVNGTPTPPSFPLPSRSRSLTSHSR